MIGIPYELFWGDMTPALFSKYANAYKRKRADLDDLNHKLGQYVAIGMNEPKKYPERPFLAKPEKHIMSDEELEQEAKRIALAFGGTINGSTDS